MALALRENRQVKNAAIEVEKYADKFAVMRTKRASRPLLMHKAASLKSPSRFPMRGSNSKPG